MDGRLEEILAGLEAGPVEEVRWNGGIRLRIAAFLGIAPLPAELVSSARAIVLRDDAVLVAVDVIGIRHILPGGRLEPGETAEAAAARELGEETGWRIGGVTPLGLLHFRHLTPRPGGYAYPYPSFLQPVFVAEADAFDSALLLGDDYVVGSAFVPLAEAGDLDLTAKERFFLDAALRLRDR
jgi:8-oxo-dGTP pyrophosphatase MutT (NUDIX family)